MTEKENAIISDLATQWQDHFHMRDQTWKVLQYSVIFFVGVVGLEIKSVDSIILILANLAVMLTSAFGVVIAFHHRHRQKEKFDIIKIYEHELGLDVLIKPVIDKAHSTWTGKINTSTYIVVMQCSLFVICFCLFLKQILS